jgi:pimeloyl-ACP methyl ester carboxylesterase
MNFEKSFLLFALLILNINAMHSQNSQLVNDKKPIILENMAMYQDIPYDTIRGVDSKLLSLDVYKNIEKYDTLPVIIYFHGGGWNLGDKALPLNLIKYFTDSGYVFVSANYRLSPDPFNIKDSNRIKFPVFTDDAAKAVKWTYDNISKYGGTPSQIILMGFSAGGNIATSLALMPEFLNKYSLFPGIIKAVVNLDGAALNIEKLIKDSNGPYKEMLINAFGNTPFEWQTASPLLNIPDSIYIPRFFCATQTNIIRRNQFQDLIDTLITRGVIHQLYTSKYFLHNDFQQRIGALDDPESKMYSDQILQFINAAVQRPKITFR